MKVLRLICLISFLLPGYLSVVPAKDLADYNVGDVSAQDIATPVALDVVDPTATASLRSTEALKVPAIFRSLANTNAMAVAFLNTFDTTHSNFLAILQETFHQLQLDESTITSPDFGYLITAFNIKNRSFPIPDSLAADWARGKPALALQNRMLTNLLHLMQIRIRPDELPHGLAIGDTIRVIPADDNQVHNAINEVAERGKLVPTSSLVTLSKVKSRFRREFSPDEQPLARAAGDFLTANCVPDHELTVLVRDHAVNQLVVSQHYNAGQIIIHRGSTVDPQTKIALYQLSDKLAADPELKAAELAMLVPAPTPPSVQTQPLPAAPQPVALTAQPLPTDTAAAAGIAPKTAPVLPWLIVGILAAVSVIAAAVAATIFIRRRKTVHAASSISTPMLVPVAKVAPVTALSASAPIMAQTELAPLVQAVKEAFIQELANQRRELIYAQQQAAVEIAELVRRLDALQAPLQQRLHTYEAEIRRLEKELAERTEENVELLKLKIQMTQDQMAAEAIHNRTSGTAKPPVGTIFN